MVHPSPAPCRVKAGHVTYVDTRACTPTNDDVRRALLAVKEPTPTSVVNAKGHMHRTTVSSSGRCIPDVMLKVGSIGTDPFPQWSPHAIPVPTADRWEWITTFLFEDDKGIKKLLKEGHHTATHDILLAIP